MTTRRIDPVADRATSDEEMLAAYLASCRRFIALARAAGESAADLPVPACPAWTVRNLLSHVASVAKLSSTGAGFGEDPQATIDREVAARSDRTLEEIAGEWEALLPTMEKIFAGKPVGPLVVDVVTHEHDLRAALGPELRDHEAGLPEALSAMVAWVRYLGLVKDPGILLRTPTTEALFGGPTVGAEVDLDNDWELFRLLGVRRSAEQLRGYPQTGDTALLFAVTSRYPLPESPLEVDD